MVEQLIKKLDLTALVRFTGRISHEQFVKEYARAAIAVVPSMYEGFGLPVGEAMACRKPVICTTGGALPEVAGDAAVLVPPGDARALETAILELLENPGEQERLADKGFNRVMTQFTWMRTAERTAACYERSIRDYH